MIPLPGDVPKSIYSLWLQGREAAPQLVRLNFSRWATLNPDYRFKVFDQNDVNILLEGADLPVDTLTPQALSDVLRARVLLDRGGIWVDASLFPVKPLDQWLPGVLTKVGFFAFERPAADRLISSWFLATAPNHPILRGWWQEITRFWSKPRELIPGTPDNPVLCVSDEEATANDEYRYFWFHYLFQYLVETRSELAELWGDCIKCSAEPPHQLQFLLAKNKHPLEAEVRAAAAAAPVQKLNWREPYPRDFLASLR